MTIPGKFDRLADDWTDATYRDAPHLFARRADLVQGLGAPLAPPASVLELGSADGYLLELLAARGFDVYGVDLSVRMVEVARARLGEARIELGDLTTYRPGRDVDATLAFRMLYLVADRPALFASIAAYTRRKLVLDLNPREASPAVVRRELAAAGFTRWDARPWLLPTRGLGPGPARTLLHALERVPALPRLAMQVRGTYVVAASKP